MDTVDAATRSKMMSRVRSKDTFPEIVVRRYLYAHGFRYRLHSKSLPGRPDIALAKYRMVIFIHGCFWHQHAGCIKSRMPKSNIEKWSKKFSENAARDRKSLDALNKMGWSVIIIWECGLGNKKGNGSLEWLPEAIRRPLSSYVEWPAPSIN